MKHAKPYIMNGGEGDKNICLSVSTNAYAEDGTQHRSPTGGGKMNREYHVVQVYDRWVVATHWSIESLTDRRILANFADQSRAEDWLEKYMAWLGKLHEATV
ncbi:hypothetical protein [Corynebacterium striatum]|nr:hypothetical protein [Corynebacterium striatum]